MDEGSFERKFQIQLNSYKNSAKSVSFGTFNEAITLFNKKLKDIDLKIESYVCELNAIRFYKLVSKETEKKGLCSQRDPTKFHSHAQFLFRNSSYDQKNIKELLSTVKLFLENDFLVQINKYEDNYLVLKGFYNSESLLFSKRFFERLLKDLYFSQQWSGFLVPTPNFFLELGSSFRNVKFTSTSNYYQFKKCLICHQLAYYYISCKSLDCGARTHLDCFFKWTNLGTLLLTQKKASTGPKEQLIGIETTELTCPTEKHPFLLNEDSNICKLVSFKKSLFK